MIDYEQWFLDLDIKNGDIILVSSDLLKLSLNLREKKQRLNIEQFIEDLMAVVGEEGTLLFPTFTWNFSNKGIFDYKNSVSYTGALSKIALKHPKFTRTKHPLYSFAVTGKYAEQLVKMENVSAFGPDSPFAFLHEKNAKNLMIAVSYQGAFTFVHYVEEVKLVPYRFRKDFKGTYIDENGIATEKNYSMYVRDIERGVQTQITEIGIEIDLAESTIHKVIEKTDFRVVQLQEAFNIIAQDIEHNDAKKLHVIK